MPNHRRRRWQGQGRCYAQQGLRHCIGSINIPSTCRRPPSHCPLYMYDDYISPCDSSCNGPSRRDRATSCRVDRSTSYRRPSVRHSKCKRRPKIRRSCISTEPFYCDDYGLPCNSRRDCQEQTDRCYDFRYGPPCFIQEPVPPCYPQDAPCFIPKATSPCYPPPCNVPPQPGPCYRPQPQCQETVPCPPPEQGPCYYIPPSMPPCTPQGAQCFTDNGMYPCPNSEYVQTTVTLPPCFYQELGPCQDHFYQFVTPPCSQPAVCDQPPVPCNTSQPYPETCPMNQPFCPQLSASVQCLPPRQDSGTICDRRNVSFGCLDSLPTCQAPDPDQFSRKCQADLSDSSTEDRCTHRGKKGKKSGKVICECSTSSTSLKKKHKKDKKKDKLRENVDNFSIICDCVSCRCDDENQQEMCVCDCSDGGRVACQCSKKTKSLKDVFKICSKGHQVTCECYDKGLDPIMVGAALLEKAVEVSHDKLLKKKSSHRGDRCHCKKSQSACKTSTSTNSACSCRYPPAFEQLSCAGNIAGSCSCKDTTTGAL